jgi:hypothetical protein
MVWIMVRRIRNDRRAVRKACCTKEKFDVTRRAVFTGLLLLAAGCATVSPEARVRSALIGAGLSPRMAGCMAERMVDRLSITQLRRLQALSKLPEKDIGAMTVDQLLHQVRALKDPEIFLVTSRAGLGCAIAG